MENTEISGSGTFIGGIVGYTAANINFNYSINCTVTGKKSVGGLIGGIEKGEVNKNYTNNTVIAEENAGGIIGYLNNSKMTDQIYIIKVFYNYIANSTINADTNVGGLIGNLYKELYSVEDYYSNYAQVDLVSNNIATTSLGIGGMQNQNVKLKNSYYYKYSSINGENPNEENEVFISVENYLDENDLKQQTTYTSKLNWSANDWNYTMLKNNKYPTINDSNLSGQTGIDLPKDSEHIIGSAENSAEMKSIEAQETLEQTFEYSDKTIETYSTYSVITSSDGSKATRNAKLYVKDNTLYAIPSLISANEDSEVVPVANNLIVDSYNVKEYETVLGSDGKIYDLKEPIEYPENFVNSDIESIGNNLNSDVKEVEVIYKNGDSIKFNYQTGEVISSSEGEDTGKTGLFDYLKEKISEIGNSNSEVSQEITTKYEESKELQTKLEETSVEEAIEKKNIANSEQGTEDITTTENNATNNSLTENKYISMYNEETGQYEIYNEEELLDTTKEEVVSENEKIEANKLSEYYASEGETKNTKMGIVWIVISIIGVGIILFVLRKNLKKKNA